jgi:fructose-1,6-bisphosphatase/sedoheptulose 1,7-bisphosphatase-like protein
MRAMIEAECPAHGIVGEEYGTAGVDREWVWVLDPVDGTRARRRHARAIMPCGSAMSMAGLATTCIVYMHCIVCGPASAPR